MKISQIKASIKSRIEYKKELTETQLQRLKICSVCPYNSANKDVKTLKEVFMIYLNKIVDRILGVYGNSEDICTKCGCNLEHKSTQTEEDLKCPLKKWK